MPDEFCKTCPDREFCHTVSSVSVPCEYVKQVNAALTDYDQRLKGKKTKMSTTPKKTVTPADVVAKAAEEKLVVPAQLTPEEQAAEAVEEVFEEADKQAEPKLTVIEGEKGEKKPLKVRLAEATEKVKKHKKALAITAAAVGVVSLTVAKYFKNQALAALDEVVAEEVELDRAKKLLQEDKHTIAEVAEILGVSTAALQRALDTDPAA